MCHLHPGLPACRRTSSHLARFADEENQERGIAEFCGARHPRRLRPSVLRAAPQRFMLRLHTAVAARRCAICTLGCPHAAAPAHTSLASWTRKIKNEELLKSAALGTPVDCGPACCARRPDASDSGQTGQYVATDVRYAPRTGRMPLHHVTPRPTCRLQKC